MEQNIPWNSNACLTGMNKVLVTLAS